jgi:hypothetical protein
MVEPQFSKLMARVRFPSSPPLFTRAQKWSLLRRIRAAFLALWAKLARLREVLNFVLLANQPSVVPCLTQ